jgi:hypothetical protein
VSSRASERGGATPYWLIVRHDGPCMSVFTTELAGEKALPVFGHPDDAKTFLRAFGSSGWQLRETGAGELVSVLFGPCAGVRKIALDLVPGSSTEALANLVSLSREAFVTFLTGKRNLWLGGGGR